MTLYHYCCSHSRNGITDRGFLRPYGRAMFGVDLVWFTDQSMPDRVGLGLTSNLLPCDRLEHQYIVEVSADQVERWLDSDIRRGLAAKPGFTVFEEGRAPDTWWIARTHVWAERNKNYSRLATPKASRLQTSRSRER